MKTILKIFVYGLIIVMTLLIGSELKAQVKVNQLTATTSLADASLLAIQVDSSTYYVWRKFLASSLKARLLEHIYPILHFNSSYELQTAGYEDASITLPKLSPTLLAYMGTGGLIENPPDDITLELILGIDTTLGIKRSWFNSYVSDSLVEYVKTSGIVDDFNRSDRLLNGDTTATGETWLCFGAGSVTARIENHFFQADSNTYAQLDYGKPIDKISGAFSFGKKFGSPNGSENTLTIIATSGDGYFGDSLLHLFIAPIGWVLQKLLHGTGGEYTQIAEGLGMTLRTDGTIYNISMEIHGDTVIVNPPQGTRVMVIDPDISTMNMTRGIWQIGGVAFTDVYLGRWNGVGLGYSKAVENIIALSGGVFANALGSYAYQDVGDSTQANSPTFVKGKFLPGDTTAWGGWKDSIYSTLQIGVDANREYGGMIQVRRDTSGAVSMRLGTKNAGIGYVYIELRDTSITFEGSGLDLLFTNKGIFHNMGNVIIDGTLSVDSLITSVRFIDTVSYIVADSILTALLKATTIQATNITGSLSGPVTTNSLTLSNSRYNTATLTNYSADSANAVLARLDTTLTTFNLFDLTDGSYSGNLKLLYDFTITKVYTVLRTDGGSDDTAKVNIYWADSLNQASPLTAWSSDYSLINHTAGQTISSFNDATIPKNNWIWVQCNDEVGTVNIATIEIVGRYDR